MKHSTHRNGYKSHFSSIQIREIGYACNGHYAFILYIKFNLFEKKKNVQEWLTEMNIEFTSANKTWYNLAICIMLTYIK